MLFGGLFQARLLHPVPDMSDDILSKFTKGKSPKELADCLTDEELKAFASGLLKTLGKQAFGTTPKREMDILIFHLLSQAEKLRQLTNYEWANVLRISESKVRALRADAALRFVQVVNTDALTEIARQFCTPGVTCMEYVEHDSRIRLLLDDPILQREFEYAVRKLGRVPDYRFNRNILDVPAATFVAVFVVNFPEYQKKFAERFKAIIKADGEYQQMIDRSKSWSQQFESICENHRAKIDLLRELVSVVVAAAGA